MRCAPPRSKPVGDPTNTHKYAQHHVAPTIFMSRLTFCFRRERGYIQLRETRRNPNERRKKLFGIWTKLQQGTRKRERVKTCCCYSQQGGDCLGEQVSTPPFRGRQTVPNIILRKCRRSLHVTLIYTHSDLFSPKVTKFGVCNPASHTPGLHTMCNACFAHALRYTRHRRS